MKNPFDPLDLKKIVVTDFETYYDAEYTLRKLRTEEYILDSRFKIHGLAVADHNGKTDFIDDKDIPKWIRAHRHHTIVNHKLTFDGLIWKFRYKHIAPAMVDTLFLANAVYGPADVSGGNGLEALAERLGLQPKGRIDMFKGVRDLSPELKQALRAYATNDADLTYKVFHIMLPQISRPEFELWLLDHTLRIYIDKPLMVLEKLAASSIRKVEQYVADKVKAIPKTTYTFAYDKKYKRKGETVSELHTEDRRVDAVTLASNAQFGQAITQILKRDRIELPTKNGKNGIIPALAKADEGFIALKSSGSERVRALVNARLAKRSGDTQTARLRTLIKAGKAGGFRVYLNYWGAHTGRWSGGSGLNAHNFPNPGRSTDDFEREVAELIRATVVPDKGKVYTATDAANIEARVLAWWARQQDLVDAFGDGTDVYSTFAQETFNEEVRKPKPEDSKNKSRRLKLLRGAGKEAILGLGYGMGNTVPPGGQYGTLELRMRSRPDIAPLFESGDLTKEKCDAIIQQYRSKYKHTVALWGKAEAAFHKAAAGMARMVNGVLFTKGDKKGDVAIILPSGRRLNYRNVRVGEHSGKRKQWVFGHGKGRKIYGGLIVENVVQAISRDILAEGVWAMEQAGYPVAYHVHDSIVCHVAKKDAKACLAYSIEVLSATPAWGAGLRLGAEGAIEEIFS